MSRRKPVTQAEMSRVLKAAQSSGQKVERFEVDSVTGKMTVVFESGSQTGTLSPFDAWKAKSDARSA
jgi:hypothetical protein